MGHAAEKLSGYALPHGEGVAMGMMILTWAAEKKGICEAGTARRLQEALEALGLPIAWEGDPEALAQAALGDKKRRGDEITLVLPRKVGECGLYPMPIAELLPWVRLGMEEAL